MSSPSVLSSSKSTRISIIGAGTIGLSFAALHLTKDPQCEVIIYDTRPDLDQYIRTNLPGYLTEGDRVSCMSRLSQAQTIAEAVQSADIVQEQGPEDVHFKTKIWPEVEQHAPSHALFWSSTSGIPASKQNINMKDASRLLVVHPYNPPHVMPLLEVVPSPTTADAVVNRTLDFWQALGRSPVLIRKECTGFVANRLAFALLREACSLVSQGVVSVEDLDEVVRASMGPRWTVAGPFKAYHAGGGVGGLRNFMNKIGGTIEDCWKASEDDAKRQDIHVGGQWQEEICRQADEAYGTVDTAERDRATRHVLAAVESAAVMSDG